MRRIRATEPPPIGNNDTKLSNPERERPSWLALGGYFEKKGRGYKGKRSSSVAQQTADKGDRGSKNDKNIT